MVSISPFMTSNRRGDAWFSVGLASSFPDITDSDSTVSELRFCDQDLARGCKVFHVSRTDSSLAAEIDQSEAAGAGSSSSELRDQVLIFRYRGKFHAVNNVSPLFPFSSPTVLAQYLFKYSCQYSLRNISNAHTHHFPSPKAHPLILRTLGLF